jgi:hypothetical protein
MPAMPSRGRELPHTSRNDAVVRKRMRSEGPSDIGQMGKIGRSPGLPANSGLAVALQSVYV